MPACQDCWTQKLVQIEPHQQIASCFLLLPEQSMFRFSCRPSGISLLCCSAQIVDAAADVKKNAALHNRSQWKILMIISQ